jgi:hypothetical protein
VVIFLKTFVSETSVSSIAIMQKPSIKRCENVDVPQFASSVFETVKGDCSLLTGSSQSPDSIWGRIPMMMGPRYSTQVDRIWVKNFFRNNRDSILELIQQKCLEKGIECIEFDTVHNTSINESTVTLYCICKSKEGSIPQHSMIECTKCRKWYHDACVHVLSRKYTKKVLSAEVKRNRI